MPSENKTPDAWMPAKVSDERLQEIFYKSTWEESKDAYEKDVPSREEVSAIAIELQHARKVLGTIAYAMEDVYEP